MYSERITDIRLSEIGQSQQDKHRIPLTGGASSSQIPTTENRTVVARTGPGGRRNGELPFNGDRIPDGEDETLYRHSGDGCPQKKTPPKRDQVWGE